MIQRWFFIVTTARKNVLKLKKIKKIHNNQKWGWQEGVAFCNYCQKKLLRKKENIMKLNQIREAHNIQAQSRQERMMFLYATTARKNHLV